MRIEDFYEARERIRAKTEVTPLHTVPEGSFRGAHRISLKLENRQRSGSFKARGAFHFMARLIERGSPPGVVTYSSGNHGRAVAEAARDAGLPAVVTVPDHVDPSKAEAIRRAGAEVVKAGPTSQSREHAACEIARARGFEVIPPFDHQWIIAGQGTVALEILERVEDLASIWVPVGGGGLASGITAVVAALRPEVSIFAVEPQGAAAYHQSVSQGERVSLPSVDSVADGLLPLQIGERNWAILSSQGVRSLTVPENLILEALRLLHRELNIFAEPSGAVAPAALLFPERSPAAIPEGHHVAIVSGGNVATDRLRRLLEE